MYRLKLTRFLKREAIRNFDSSFDLSPAGVNFAPTSIVRQSAKTKSWCLSLINWTASKVTAF